MVDLRCLKAFDPWDGLCRTALEMEATFAYSLFPVMQNGRGEGMRSFSFAL